jgi:hypothetical protein
MGVGVERDSDEVGEGGMAAEWGKEGRGMATAW